jgi:hypothetical protein
MMKPCFFVSGSETKCMEAKRRSRHATSFREHQGNLKVTLTFQAFRSDKCGLYLRESLPDWSSIYIYIRLEVMDPQSQRPRLCRRDSPDSMSRSRVPVPLYTRQSRHIPPHTHKNKLKKDLDQISSKILHQIWAEIILVLPKYLSQYADWQQMTRIRFPEGIKYFSLYIIITVVNTTNSK